MKGPRLIGAPLGLPKKIPDRVGRQAARYIARLMPTHSIGDQKQTILREDAEAILIHLTLEAHIGQPCSNKIQETVSNSVE